MKTFNSVVCLKCGHSFIAQKDVFAEIKHDQIYVADNIGFAGSQITCSNCSEVHEYMADKEILTLQLVTIPVNHKGSPSKIFYPNDSQETVDQHINIELLEAVKTGAFNKMKTISFHNNFFD